MSSKGEYKELAAEDAPIKSTVVDAVEVEKTMDDLPTLDAQPTTEAQSTTVEEQAPAVEVKEVKSASSQKITPKSINISKTNLVTDENGGKDWFEVSMNEQPNQEIKISIIPMSQDEVQLSITEISFTKDTWNVARRVEVTGLDDNVLDGNKAYKIKIVIEFGGAQESPIELVLEGINADNEVADPCADPTNRVSWYLDQDSDGLGDPAALTTKVVCDGSEPSGYVRNKSDAAPTCSTNNLDVCDVCAGTGKKQWYRDVDGDGLGDPTNKIQACKKPADDYTLNAENLNFTSTAPTTNIRIHTKYQYQVTTDAVSTSTLTYALKDAPAGMTISTSGLVQWTPGSEEDIKNHSSIKLQISSSNGSLKEQVFSVGVEGSCSREFRLWEGDQRSSVNASKELSSLYVYSDSASNPKNPVQNYNYGGSARHSANITHGKQPVEDKGVFFLYQEHDKTDRFYLFMILNKEVGQIRPATRRRRS